MWAPARFCTKRKVDLVDGPTMTSAMADSPVRSCQTARS